MNEYQKESSHGAKQKAVQGKDGRMLEAGSERMESLSSDRVKWRIKIGKVKVRVRAIALRE